jgi:tetratricopeptide (TPR) repeat protein
LAHFYIPIENYTKSLELRVLTLNLAGLIEILAACPDEKYLNGKQAVEYAQKLLEIAEDESAYHFSLVAAAYAEADNFEEAIQAQEKAISLLEDDQKKTRTDYEGRLASYKAGKPWRMEPPKGEEKQ